MLWTIFCIRESGTFPKYSFENTRIMKLFCDKLSIQPNSCYALKVPDVVIYRAKWVNFVLKIEYHDTLWSSLQSAIFEYAK